MKTKPREDCLGEWSTTRLYIDIHTMHIQLNVLYTINLFIIGATTIQNSYCRLMGAISLTKHHITGNKISVALWNCNIIIGYCIIKLLFILYVWPLLQSRLSLHYSGLGCILRQHNVVNKKLLTFFLGLLE